MANSLAQEGNVASEFVVNAAGTKGNFRLAVDVGNADNRSSVFINVSVFGESLIKNTARSLKVGQRVIVLGRLDGYKSDKTFYQKDGAYVAGVDIFTIAADSIAASYRFHEITTTKIEKGAAASTPVAAPVAAPAAPVAQPVAAPAVAAAPVAVAAGAVASYGDDDF